jgi:hypothetical protein
MTWRVTHIDHRGRRRILQLECDARAAAEGLAEAMYGAAFYLAAIRLRGAP